MNISIGILFDLAIITIIVFLLLGIFYILGGIFRHTFLELDIFSKIKNNRFFKYYDNTFDILEKILYILLIPFVLIILAFIIWAIVKICQEFITLRYIIYSIIIIAIIGLIWKFVSNILFWKKSNNSSDIEVDDEEIPFKNIPKNDEFADINKVKQEHPPLKPSERLTIPNLECIAEGNFRYFLTLAEDYKKRDIEYYNKFVNPVIEKYSHLNKGVKPYDLNLDEDFT